MVSHFHILFQIVQGVIWGGTRAVLKTGASVFFLRMLIRNVVLVFAFLGKVYLQHIHLLSNLLSVPHFGGIGQEQGQRILLSISVHFWSIRRTRTATAHPLSLLWIFSYKLLTNAHFQLQHFSLRIEEFVLMTKKISEKLSFINPKSLTFTSLTMWMKNLIWGKLFLWWRNLLTVNFLLFVSNVNPLKTKDYLIMKFTYS